MTEQRTDYVLETEEALALLHGLPLVHTVAHAYDLPPAPAGYEYAMIQLDDPAEVGLYCQEGWLMKSTKIEAWYLFVLVRETDGNNV